VLAGKVVMATVPVRDLRRARPFYENVLGLKLVGDQDSEALTFETAN
jgi:catechol 2,3-dioxygenase-like lactoylglutathione lyase family enzyme